MAGRPAFAKAMAGRGGTLNNPSINSGYTGQAGIFILTPIYRCDLAEQGRIYPVQSAGVAKMADALALGASDREIMRVQISPPAPWTGRAQPYNPPQIVRLLCAKDLVSARTCGFDPHLTHNSFYFLLLP